MVIDTNKIWDEFIARAELVLGCFIVPIMFLIVGLMGMNGMKEWGFRGDKFDFVIRRKC